MDERLKQLAAAALKIQQGEKTYITTTQAGEAWKMTPKGAHKNLMKMVHAGIAEHLPNGHYHIKES